MKRLACLGLFLLACGGSSTPDNFHDLLDDVRHKGCELNVECGEYPDVATCLAVSFDNAKQLTLEAEITAGRVDYNQSAAGDCLDAFGQLSCDRTTTVSSHVLDVCDDVLVGHVEVGGDCWDSEQCVATARCSFPSTCGAADQCCKGMCTAKPPSDPVAIGGDCSQSFTCVDGAYCKMSGTTFTCTAQMSGEGTACDSFSACQPPLQCNLDFQTNMGTCYKPAAHGATCDPMVTFAACALAADFCDATAKVCKSRAKPGEACSGGDETCVGYATCDPNAGMCQAVPGLGQTCMPGQSCLGQLECTSGTCSAPPAAMACTN